jgi:hypothetical protein
MALVAFEATVTAAGNSSAVAVEEAAPLSAVEVGGGSGRGGKVERCPPRLFPAGCRSSMWLRMWKPVILLAGDVSSDALGVGSELEG